MPLPTDASLKIRADRRACSSDGAPPTSASVQFRGKVMRIWSYLLLVIGIVGTPVAAQAQFTPSDVQKLEEEFHIAQVPPNLAAIKASNPTAYAELLMRRFYPRIQDMCISRGVPIDNEIFGKAMKLLDIGI